MGNDTGLPSTLDSLELMLRAADAAPAIPASLEKGSTIGGRYVIESVLGTGGMGVVYLAHDQQLGRPVALKLHRTFAASDRLRREAVAMAKLAHPNVVGVYEVGAYEDRSFVAMEYIEGSTLRSWVESKPRSRREILDALAAAGAGLSAAHRAGLVHRDVKPENIFVGADGRVRIGDFGLVRIGEGDDSPRAVPELAIGDATRTGTVMGTPAYMAPEQLEGGLLDARTDQFAFGVVAWELLAGRRPFGGGTTSAVRDAMNRGPTVASGKVPVRLRRVLARALAVEPAQRWSSIHAFVTALQAAERRPRIVAAALVATLATSGIATYALWPAPDPMAVCDDAPDELAAALPVPSTTALVARITTSGAPTGPERATQVSEAIAALRARHAVASRATCTARVERTWTPRLAAASAECLAAERAVARETMTALPIVAETSADFVQLAASLPTFARCRDEQSLASTPSVVPPGADGPAVLTARARADVLEQLLKLGHVKSVAAAYPGLAASAVAQVPSVAQRLQLLAVEIDIARGRVTDVEQRLGAIYYEARTHDDSDTMLSAVEQLINFTYDLRHDADGAKRWSDNGVSDAERESVRQPDAATRVLLAAAAAAMDRKDPAAATALLNRATALTTPLTPVFIRAALEGMRAQEASDATQRKEADAASNRQIALLEEAVGPTHPAVAAALALRAQIMNDLGNRAQSEHAADRARAIINVDSAPNNLDRASAEVSIAAAILSVAGTTEWEPILLRARETYVSAFGEDHPDVANIDVHLATGYNDRGEPDRALPLLVHAVKVQEHWLGPQSLKLAAGLYGLSAAQRISGQLPAAIATVRRAEQIFAATEKGSPNHVKTLAMLAMELNLAGEHREARTVADQALELASPTVQDMGPAWALLEGARARIALEADLDEAEGMLTTARSMFEQLNIPWRVKEASALMQRLAKR